ncbi:MAG: hypothetical protein GY754_05095 [bacterium]|nr:hypothetical protein [bacterium]
MMVIEIILYIISIGIVAYFAEKQYWTMFIISISICLILFIIIKIFKSKPFNEKINSLIKKEFKFSSKFLEYGIQNFYNMQNEEMHERNLKNIEIIKNGNKFSLLAESGNSYINPSARRHWDEIKLKLDKEISLKLLLVNPFCESKRIRDEVNGVTTILDPKLRLDLIESLHNNYPNVEIKFTDEIYCTLFFSDHEMIYDPYHLGIVK